MKTIILALLLVSTFSLANNVSNSSKDFKQNVNLLWGRLPDTLIREKQIKITKDQLYPYVEHFIYKVKKLKIRLTNKQFLSVINNYTVSLVSLKLLELYADKFLYNEELQERRIKKNNLKMNKKSINWKKGKLIEEVKKDITTTIYNDLIIKMNISNEEIEEYYRKNKKKWLQPEKIELYHVLIEEDKNTSNSQAEIIAGEIFNKILNGSDLSEFAERYNKRQSKNTKGYVGWFERGGLIPELNNICWEMVPNRLNEPILVKSSEGWHIIKVTDYKPEYTYPVEKLKDSISKILAEEKAFALLNEWRAKSNEESIQIINKSKTNWMKET